VCAKCPVGTVLDVRLLLTNDDGIRSPGLHALIERAVAAGHEVLVAAPLEDYSGWGAALGPLHVTGSIVYEVCDLEHIAPCAAFGVDGPPALAVMAACLGAFGPPPEVVVSGINPGANTGQAVIHSGTVGAALTGLHFDIPGVAISLALGASDGSQSAPRRHWDTAATAAMSVLHWLAAGAGPAVVLNVNVPNVAAHRLRGACAAGLASAGIVQAVATDAGPGRITIEVPPHRVPEPGSDWAVLEEGFVAVTPLRGFEPVSGVDLLKGVSMIERALTAPALAVASR
jgi:5'-nucleotidase